MNIKNQIVITTNSGLTITGFSSESQAARVASQLTRGKSEESILANEMPEKKYKKMKCGRANTHVTWTPKEDAVMEANMTLGPSALSRVPELRERHTKNAIAVHYYVVRERMKENSLST